MPLNFDEVKYIVGSAEIAEKMAGLKPLKPFDDRVLNFFADLSAKLMVAGREYPDVATFGFWCRKAALRKEKSMYDDLDSRLGRGVVFHSTPSNVAVNFAYSFAAGLLAGNANLLRLPAKEFVQVDLICSQISALLQQQYTDLQPYVCMVKYASKREISDAFSAMCNTRVIWGGDQTVQNLRQSPLPPRANEITFADRYSFLVIEADAYLKADNKEQLIQDFYNDTFLSDQNACTSPCVVVWLGRNKNAAQKDFWEWAEAKAKRDYQLAAVQAVGKLDAFYQAAVAADVKLQQAENNLILRLKVQSLDFDVEKLKYNSGFFFEYDAGKLSEVLPLCKNKCQTMTYYGLDKNEIKKFFAENLPGGIDRAVPLGKSMDFSLVWDGYDLIREMSRKISVL